MVRLKIGSRNVSVYSLAVTIVAISFGIVGFGTGSFLLINAFLWIAAIVLWLLVALGIASFAQGRRRKVAMSE